MYEYGIAFIGLFLGCLFRLLLPFLEKGNGVAFDNKYITSMITAFITSLVVASTLISTIRIDDSVPSLILLFASTFLQGWGTTDIFNKVGIDWREKKP